MWINAHPIRYFHHPLLIENMCRGLKIMRDMPIFETERARVCEHGILPFVEEWGATVVA